MAEQIGARHGLDWEARRHGGGDHLKQVGGVADAGARVDLALWGVSSSGRSVSVPIAMRTRVAPALREFCNASVITSESVLA